MNPKQEYPDWTPNSEPEPQFPMVYLSTPIINGHPYAGWLGSAYFCGLYEGQPPPIDEGGEPEHVDRSQAGPRPDRR
jgi:hypothetical protein